MEVEYSDCEELKRGHVHGDPLARRSVVNDIVRAGEHGKGFRSRPAFPLTEYARLSELSEARKCELPAKRQVPPDNRAG